MDALRPVSKGVPWEGRLEVMGAVVGMGDCAAKVQVEQGRISGLHICNHMCSSPNAYTLRSESAEG